jgi:cell volume regulation protein A
MPILPAIAIHLETGNVLLFFSFLVLVAILISRLGAKFGVPAMLLFLLIGMAAGPDGIGVEIKNHELAEFLGHLGITFILLSGGLRTSLAETRPVMARGLMLSTVGLAITTLATGFFIFWALGARIGGAGLTLLGCFLLAAILSSTDSPSVFSVLRSKRLTLRENLDPVLELESGSNDPMAYTLTLILVSVITSADHMGLAGSSWLYGAFIVIVTALWQILSGFAIGLGVGFGARWLMRRFRLSTGPLYSILILMLALFANGLASMIGGNGLVALYVAAIVIGNMRDLPFKKDVLKFFDSTTWMAQLLMFLLLGLLARPSHMPAVMWPALLIGVFIMFVGRPLGVFLSLLPFRRLSVRARAYISWAGMKGAGPILFAMCAVLGGVKGGVEIFNIVFCITLLSLLVQGTLLVPVARKLDLCIEDDPEAETFGMEIPEEMGMLRDHTVTEEDLSRGPTLRDLHLPHGIRVVMVRRKGKFIVPHGSLELKVGDELVIIMGDTED